VAAVRALFIEYGTWLGTVVCSRRLAEEIADLPGPYGPPAGVLLLAVNAAGPAGVVGARPHEGDACEMKRLYVRPAARGSGLGRRLAEAAIDAGRRLGYRRMYLTTLPQMMPEALGMYERLGFTPTEPFFDHSAVGEDVTMEYLELVLGRVHPR